MQSSPDEFDAVAEAEHNVVHNYTNNITNNNLMNNNEFKQGKSFSEEFNAIAMSEMGNDYYLTQFIFI